MILLNKRALAAFFALGIISIDAQALFSINKSFKNESVDNTLSEAIYKVLPYLVEINVRGCTKDIHPAMEQFLKELHLEIIEDSNSCKDAPKYKDKALSTGTGFIIYDKDRVLVATNHHVVKKADDYDYVNGRFTKSNNGIFVKVQVPKELRKQIIDNIRENI